MNEEKKKEFFTKFTDGIDEENNYYDSQFEGQQPYKLWKWIDSELKQAEQRGYDKHKKELQQMGHNVDEFYKEG